MVEALTEPPPSNPTLTVAVFQIWSVSFTSTRPPFCTVRFPVPPAEKLSPPTNRLLEIIQTESAPSTGCRAGRAWMNADKAGKNVGNLPAVQDIQRAVAEDA